MHNASMRINCKYGSAVTLAAILVLFGCSSSQIVSNLQLVVDGVSAALPAIASATGLPASTVASVETYLSQVNTAAESAATILASTATAQQKAAQIAAAFAGIVQPDLPPSAQAIAGLVQTIVQDISKFLISVGAPLPGAMSPASVPSNAKLSAADLSKLTTIHSKIAENGVKLARMKGSR